MRIFNYHPKTAEYLGSENADESPLEPGVFLIPAFATSSPPPEKVPVGLVSIWTGEEWEIVPDHRGAVYWTAEGEKIEIIKPGEVVPDDGLLEKPDLRTEAEIAAAESAAKIESIRDQLFEVFAGLPVAVRSEFYLDRVKIAAAFDDGDTQVALSALVNLPASSDEERAAKAELMAIVAPLLPTES